MIENTQILIDAALQIAKKTNSKAILLYVDEIPQLDIIKELEQDCTVIIATRDKKIFEDTKKIRENILLITSKDTTRIGLIKNAIFTAMMHGLLQRGDKVVCLTGKTGKYPIDTIVLLDAGEEFESVVPIKLAEIAQTKHPEILEAALDIAMELANEGREGNPVGLIFVIGDSTKVLKYSRQLIFNPFKGYSEKEKSILDPQVKESIKEFAQIDGAFIIKSDGIVLSAGSYIDASLKGVEMPLGLGSRHVAAASITANTNSIAITLSQSTKTIRIFKDGKIIMEIENPPEKKI